MLDWTKINTDPTHPLALQAVEHYLAKYSDIKIRKWKDNFQNFNDYRDSVIIEILEEYDSVLDIGCADHTLSPDSPNWRHGKLRKALRNVHGVDSNLERINYLQDNYRLDNLHYIDTSQEPQRILENEQFGAVFAGDVIEHVSNTGNFLKFIHLNLRKDGIAIITTPNFFGGKRKQYLSSGKVIDNLEHTCWISPFQMNELCRLNGFHLSKIIYLTEGRKKIIINRIIPKAKARMKKYRDVWVDEYIYVLSKKASKDL